MKIEAESKFEIGEIVSVKGSELRLLIQEIMVQKCYGGLQINYVGFPMYIDKYSLREDRKPMVLPKEGLATLCESVLEKFEAIIPEKKS